MKRFWLVLLSLGLVMAFSASVFAADVKFSGSYTAAGMYQDKTTFRSGGSADGPSTSFYYQRLRVQAEFIATPALKLVTRFDAMERVWGNARSAASLTNDFDSYASRNENENIAFDYAYIWYASPIGIWSVGIMEDGAWGTTFGNNGRPEGKITYTFVKMPIVVGAQIVKLTEKDKNAVNSTETAVDRDADKYQAYVIYNFKGGSAGVLGYYKRDSNWRPLSGFQTNVYGFVPYAKAKIGPVALEAEVHYLGGKIRKYETATEDITASQLTAYIDALADFGMFYAGATLAYVAGDHPETPNKAEGGNIDGGWDYNPCLIMFNYERTYWAGAIPGHGTTSMSGPMTNAWFGQLRGGVRPIAALDLGASVSYAKADRLAGQALEKDYGIELDVTATYKITNNLSYMLGVGYLFTGDYYQGTSSANEIDDNFIVLNKLTLTF